MACSNAQQTGVGSGPPALLFPDGAARVARGDVSHGSLTWPPSGALGPAPPAVHVRPWTESMQETACSCRFR